MREVPARAEAPPLAVLYPPLKRIEPLPLEGDEQRTIDVDGHQISSNGVSQRKTKYRPRPGRYQKRDNPIGAPPFEPSPDQRKMVQILVGVSVPLKTIARNIGPDGISMPTLHKHFAEELETGKEQLVASIKTALVKSAQGGSVRAMTYLLDRIGGPEFAPRLRLGGDADAPPIEVNMKAQVSLYLPDNGRASNT